MSDDLISRERAIFFVSDCLDIFEINVGDKMANSLIKILENQPSVYSVDKVVEQLEDLKRRYWFTIANTGNEKLNCAYENVGNALDRAIEIVKSGGVAND